MNLVDKVREREKWVELTDMLQRIENNRKAKKWANFWRKVYVSGLQLMAILLVVPRHSTPNINILYAFLLLYVIQEDK